MKRITAFSLALLVGLIIFILVNTLLIQAHVGEITAIGISLALGSFHIGLVIVSWKRYKRRSSYEYRAMSLYTDVRKHLVTVQGLIPQISSFEMFELLTEFCEDAETLLQKFEEKNPTSRITSATMLGAHLLLIERDLLPQYLELQNEPRYLHDAAEKLTRAQSAIKRFHELLLNTITALEDGDDIRFEAAIKILDPGDRIQKTGTKHSPLSTT